MWGVPTREGLGGNVPTREFEGMDSLMMAARLLRVLAAAKKKGNMLIFHCKFATEINFEALGMKVLAGLCLVNIIKVLFICSTTSL